MVVVTWAVAEIGVVSNTGNGMAAMMHNIITEIDGVKRPLRLYHSVANCVH